MADTRTLDEILQQAFTDGASDTMWQDERHIEIFATAKQELEALIANERREAKAEAKAELRAKFGIEADKQYDVKIGNGVIVAQLQPTKEESDGTR